jgi:fructose-specific phosphotransferase system IIA component
MTLLELISEKSVLIGLHGSTKSEIVEELVQAIEDEDRILDRKKVLDSVLQREGIMSTGIGHGIAIPHGKSDAVNKLCGVLGIKREGVDFESLDGQPAFIFFLLVSPIDVSGPHIKALARISRLLKGEEFRKALVQARSPGEVISIVAEEEKRHPAPTAS